MFYNSETQFLQICQFFTKVESTCWHRCNLMCVELLVVTENEANTRPLQKWTCLWVFELLLRFLSSEHSKHIQKNLWLRIFHSLHEFFEKNIFVPQYSQKWAFCKQILTKISFGASKKLKKTDFFRFFKNAHRFDIWSL